MTQELYLEMTYRRGKPFAGYLHLPCRDGDQAVRSRKVAPGLVVDYTEDERPLGIEIVSPGTVSIEDIQRVLSDLHCRQVTQDELAPLHSA